MPCGLNAEIGWIPIIRKVDLDDEVNAKDHLEIGINLLPLASRERLDSMVREALEKRGWTRGEDGTMTKKFGDAIATLPPGELVIRLSTEASKAIAASGQATQRAPEETEEVARKVSEAARKTAEANLERERRAANDALVRRNVAKILEVEPDVRAEVTQVVNEVTRGALILRANELGRIESVQEDRDAEGRMGLVITVKS
jgi:hypothetical protein